MVIFWMMGIPLDNDGFKSQFKAVCEFSSVNFAELTVEKQYIGSWGTEGKLLIHLLLIKFFPS